MRVRSSRAVSSGSSRPTPTVTTSAEPRSSAIPLRSPPSTVPRSLWGRPTTPASGVATAIGTAADEATAMVRCPAPTRSAASPASCTAPGVRAAPPTIRTWPRPYLEPDGLGSGHERSRVGVTSRAGRGSGSPAESGLGVDIALSRVIGDRCRRLLQMPDVVEQPELPTPVGAAAEMGDGDVLDGCLGPDVEDLTFGEALADVAERQHQRVVAEHDRTGSLGRRVQVQQEAADPEHDVRPGLASRGPVVELAQPLTPFGLQWEAAQDTLPGEHVEDTELAVAQPLVQQHRQVSTRAGQADLRGLLRPDVGGGPDGRRHTVGQQGLQAAGQRLGLVDPSG